MGSLCALGCRVIYNYKAGVSGRSLREVFKGGFYGYRAGPPLLLLVTAYVPIRRTVDEGPAGLKFTLHGGPVGGDGAQGEKTGLPGSAPTQCPEVQVVYLAQGLPRTVCTKTAWAGGAWQGSSSGASVPGARSETSCDFGLTLMWDILELLLHFDRDKKGNLSLILPSLPHFTL